MFSPYEFVVIVTSTGYKICVYLDLGSMQNSSTVQADLVCMVLQKNLTKEVEVASKGGQAINFLVNAGKSSNISKPFF
jgi:hypothetical protein